MAANAERRLVHMLKLEDDHPVDYSVPDFGLAHETRYTLNNIAKAEKQYKHKLNFMNDPDPAEDHPVNYNVANFGVDEDIKTTQSNIG